MDKRILKKWLKAGYIDNKQRFNNKAGTPQGSVISPTLANMVLDGLQQTIDQFFNIKRRLGAPNPKRIHFVRYADDFIITAKDKADLIAVQPCIEQFLNRRGLSLSKEKTKITNIAEGFDFLGKHIRKYKGKLLTTPSKKNVKKLLTKVKTTIRTHRSSPTFVLINELNPILRGWANYHKGDAAKKTFQKIDHFVLKMIWKWARRRHPQKRQHWVKNRYFTRIKHNHWVFYTPLPNGQKCYLYRVAYTTYCSANPFQSHGKSL